MPPKRQTRIAIKSSQNLMHPIEDDLDFDAPICLKGVESNLEKASRLNCCMTFNPCFKTNFGKVKLTLRVLDRPSRYDAVTYDCEDEFRLRTFTYFELVFDHAGAMRAFGHLSEHMLSEIKCNFMAVEGITQVSYIESIDKLYHSRSSLHMTRDSTILTNSAVNKDLNQGFDPSCFANR